MRNFWCFIRRKIHTTIIVCVASAFITSFAQATETPKWDDQLIVQTLNNGFRYVVHDSNQESAPFNLRLIVNVGSVDDELKGMAHIIEHMVFRTNSGLGSSVHQYHIAFNAAMQEQDWAVEKKVIIEEMRLGTGVAERINNEKKAIVRNNSRYVQRPTIGLAEDVQKVAVQDIKDFYTRFYVPANMTLVVSGNIDEKTLQKAIADTFGKQPFKAKPERDYLELPLQKQRFIGKVQDPQGVTSMVSMGFRSPLQPYDRMAGLYQRLQNYFLRKLAVSQVRSQLDAHADQGIESLSMTFKESTNERLVVALAARTANHDQGMVAVLTEIERLKQNGLRRTELEKLKEKAKKTIANNVEAASLRNFQQWEDKITTAIMQDGMLEDYNVRAKRNLQWIDAMTLDELNARLRTLLSADDQFVYYQVPGAMARNLPSQQHIDQLQSSIASKPLSYEVYSSSRIVSAPAIKEKTTIHWPEDKQHHGTAIKPEAWDKTSVKRWTLDNGDSVVWLNRPTADGNLYIKMLSSAGYENQQSPAWLSRVAAQVWEQADFSFATATQVSAWKAEQGVQWQWSQKQQQLDLSALIQPEKLPSLMALYAAHHKHWRITEREFKQLNRQILAESGSMATTAGASLVNVDASGSLQPHSLTQPMLEQKIQALSEQPVTLFIVGELAQGSITESVIPYLAGLPRQKATAISNERQPGGHQKIDRKIHNDNKATVTVKGISTMPWSPEASFLVSTLNPIIQKALKNEL